MCSLWQLIKCIYVEFGKCMCVSVLGRGALVIINFQEFSQKSLIKSPEVMYAQGGCYRNVFQNKNHWKKKQFKYSIMISIQLLCIFSSMFFYLQFFCEYSVQNRFCIFLPNLASIFLKLYARLVLSNSQFILSVKFSWLSPGNTQLTSNLFAIV